MNVPLPSAQATEPDQELPPIGMAMGAARDLIGAGAAPKYGSVWIGLWNDGNWNSLNETLRTGRSLGVTPVVYWYYWGDSISPSCVENGCDGRTKEHWFEMTRILAERIEAEMGGEQVIVVVENEFNKGGIPAPEYAPTFDGYLEKVALDLRQVPGVRIVMGFGAWSEETWSRFPLAIASSDYIGFQMMRGSTRHSEAEYRQASDEILRLSRFVSETFNKPSFLYDLALSSYPDAHWEQLQMEELEQVFDALVKSGATGLQGVVYRTLYDNPNMGLHNYFGMAERHWGLWYAEGGAKPSWQVWLDRLATPLPEMPPNVPGGFEAEELEHKDNGAAFNDKSASGGQGWTLWSNGQMRQTLVSDAAQVVRVTVVARGSMMDGVGPRMDVRLNDRNVDTHMVQATSWTTYTSEFTMPGGASRFALAFTNDGRSATEDRNFHVDRFDVEVLRPNAPPEVALDVAGRNFTWSFDAGASYDPDGDRLTYEWDLGDGNRSTLAALTHSYTQPGNYSVQLRVSDGIASASKSFVVEATVPPSAPGRIEGEAFDLKTNGQSFYDVSASGTRGWQLWSNGQMSHTLLAEREQLVDLRLVARSDMLAGIGARVEVRMDGVTQTTIMVDSAQWASYHAQVRIPAGTSTLTLAYTNDQRTSTEDRNFRLDVVVLEVVNQPPLARFTAEGSELAWRFDAGASSDPDGDTLSFAWDLGDGTRATGARVEHVYAQPGSYLVRLSLSDGQAEAEASEAVEATERDPPVAAFNASVDDLRVELDARSSSGFDNASLTYSWELGDGSTGEGALLTHTYETGGSYQIRLHVSDGAREAEANATVLVNRAPVALFDAAMSGYRVDLDASASSDPDGDILKFAWDLGDGTLASGVNLSHVYAAEGDYTIRLVVSDGDREAEANASVFASRALSASFNATTNGLSVELDASSTYRPTGGTLTYAWDLGDGASATGELVTHTYAEPGVYSVTLRVSDRRGSDELTKEVTVERPNQAPTAAFDASGEGRTWVFDAGMSTDPDGDALSYAWDFGEGSHASGARVEFTYLDAGEYVVRLVVSDGELSNESRTLIRVVVPNSAPVAVFHTSGAGLAWSFDAGASSDPDGDALSYSWELGDGTNATGPNVTHTYAQPGDYPVRLVVSDGTLDDAASATVTATPPANVPGAFEGEAFEHKDNGAGFNDASASAGRAWNLWANGQMRQTFVSDEEQTLRVTVFARADLLQGIGARMDVRLDGAVLATHVVGETRWTSYVTEVRVPAGTSMLALAFTNDQRTTSEDRNLRVDRVLVEVAPPPGAREPIRLEAEHAQVKDSGRASSDTSASGGSVWVLWSNGGIHQELQVPAGRWRIDVVAQGEDGQGWPRMDIRVDGATLATHMVDPAGLATYAAEVEFATDGARKVSIAYTNDARGTGWDRNLRVDLIVLTPL